MTDRIIVDNVEIYPPAGAENDGIFVKCRGDNRFIMLSELRELATTDHPVEIS